MILKRKYKITVEDEATLQKKINISARAYFLLPALFVLFIITIFIASLFLSVTPLKNLLPGYLKESERAATEEQHLRLDSLIHVYDVNQAYLNGILRAMDPQLTDSINYSDRLNSVPLSVDSLLPVSDLEKEFIDQIRERDKYNIAVVSPSDAETIMFENINPSAIISEDSKDSYKSIILLPKDAPVSAVADGKILAIYPTIPGKFDVIIQHNKGFISKTGRLSRLMVNTGDRVTAGQIIASTSSQGAQKANTVEFELWHDGNRLIPSRYLNKIN